MSFRLDWAIPSEFQAGLNYIYRPCLREKKKNKTSKLKYSKTSTLNTQPSSYSSQQVL